jgi:DNA invertase Pin-like site-specific DNA recombinase
LQSVAFLSKNVDNEFMDIQTIINKVGSQSELARLLGVSRGAVWLWKRDGIPQSRVWQLQALHPKLFKELK